MSTHISCPQCGHQFEPADAIKKELQSKMIDWQKKKEEEFFKKEELLQQQQRELVRIKGQQEEELKRRVEEAYKLREAALTKELTENLREEQGMQLKMLEEKTKQQADALKVSQQKEIDFLRKMETVEAKERELELETQRRLSAERQRVAEQVRKEEDERSRIRELEFEMKFKELQLQLDAQKKLAEEMQRRAEQGSMQLQGEAQELVLEELLRGHFPADGFSEVGKGDEGADITHTVVNDLRQSCGIIVYESKRTKHWSDKWIDKLKMDMRNGKADIAVIVTKVLPKGIEKFGHKEGIWICSFDNVGMVATILRHGVIKVYEANKMLENVTDKKESLYKYMTGNEFRQKWEAIIETYMNMQNQLQKEKVRVMKEWGEREKQLNIMLKSTTAFIGDIKGIGGLEMQELNLINEGYE